MSMLVAFGAILGLVYFVYLYKRKKDFLETPIPLRVRKVRHYSERYISLTLQRPDCSRLPPWTPGSHIVVNMDAPAGKYRRAYSIMDGDTHSWEIVISVQPGGRVSNNLKALKVGHLIYAQPPRGRFFKLQTSTARQICLIGAGAGIAPLVPMARQALTLGYQVLLIHSARYERELIKAKELRALTNNNSNFRYIAVVTRETCENPEIYEGRIHQRALQEWGLAHFKGEVYLCGSSVFVAEQATHLRQLGYQGKILKESFTGSGGNSSAQIQVGNRSFTQGHSATLLAACEENGVLPFAECRTGHCLNCRAQLHSGEVSYIARPQNHAPLRANEILPCICVPTSDVVLDIHSAKIRN